MPARERMVELFKETGLHAFVAHSYVNVSYLTQANIFTQRLIPDRLACVLWPAESDPVFIVCSIEEVAARRDSLIEDIRTYVEHKESPIHLLGEVIRERKLQKGRIGIEENVMTARHYKELSSELPHAKITGCDRALARIRMVKDGGEVELLKSAILATDAAISATCENAAAGMSERQLAKQLREFLYEKGADEVSHLILSVGENIRDVHHLPGDLEAKAGDLLHIDVGGKFGNYFSDLGRMSAIGEPTPDHMENYHLVWKAVQKLVDEAKPGICAKDLYAVYKRDALNHHLFDERLCPHVGHGLGVELHEHPILEPANEEQLCPGMVLAVEVAHRSSNGFVYHTEDIIHITADGSEVLSRSRDWRQLLISQ